MRIGVPCEPADQPRAAASPQTVERMIRLGYEVLVESGAGARAKGAMTVKRRVSVPRRRSCWGKCRGFCCQAPRRAPPKDLNP